jgi:hypothetical protein
MSPHHDLTGDPIHWSSSELYVRRPLLLSVRSSGFGNRPPSLRTLHHGLEFRPAFEGNAVCMVQQQSLVGSTSMPATSAAPAAQHSRVHRQPLRAMKDLAVDAIENLMQALIGDPQMLREAVYC